MANAGVAAQLPLVGGNPEVMERTLAVNVMGVYNTLRAAGPHISHPGGYALPVASLAAAVHAPLLGAYSASKAGVEALGNTLRVELRPAGAKVGVAYFAELDTDMTQRGFGTEAAAKMKLGARSTSRRCRWASTRSSAASPAARAGCTPRAGSGPCCRCGWPSSRWSTAAGSWACARRWRPPGARTRR